MFPFSAFPLTYVGTHDAIADEKTCYAGTSISVSSDLRYRRMSSKCSGLAGGGDVCLF